MTSTITTVRIEVVPDETPDASYLEQDEFADRRAQYEAGEFSFVGVRAVAELTIKTAAGAIRQTIASPGLWSVESDSEDDYIREIGRDEVATLRELLAELGANGYDWNHVD